MKPASTNFISFERPVTLRRQIERSSRLSSSQCTHGGRAYLSHSLQKSIVAVLQIPCAKSTSPRKQSAHMLLGEGCIFVPQTQHRTSANLVTDDVVIEEYDLFADIVISQTPFFSFWVDICAMNSSSSDAFASFTIENDMRVCEPVA
jgi:hypothetical protein